MSSFITEDPKWVMWSKKKWLQWILNVLQDSSVKLSRHNIQQVFIMVWYGTWLMYIKMVWLNWDHIKLITACHFIHKKHLLHKSFATVNNWNSYVNCVSLTKQKLYMEHKTNMVRTAAGACLSCLLNICLTFQVPTSWYWTCIKVHQSFKMEDFIFWSFVIV